MARDLPKLLADRRFRAAPFLTFVGTFAILNVAAWSQRSTIVAERQANLLQPVAGAAPAKAEPIARYDRSVGRELEKYLPAIPDATKQKLVILMGMSQMYAINDGKPNDETISELMDDYYAPRNTRVFGLAAPNLDNEEALLLLLSTLERRETTPAVLIYGVCFDKFRNVGIRPEMLKYMEGRGSLSGRWSEVMKMAQKNYPLAAAQMRSSVASSASGALPNARSPKDSSGEQRLRSLVSQALPLVKERTDLNANFQDRLYRIRNRVFRISNSTKRPILQSRYDMNREFLGLIADVAAANNVRLVLYVIPLNPLAETPYIPEQYASFKSWLSGFAQQRRIPFANLENAVPAEDWGLLNGTPDFKHFRKEGHRLTAIAIAKQFDSIIGKAQPAGEPVH